MSELSYVVRRLQAGASVRILQDGYGQEVVEVRRKWLPMTRRLKLQRDDMSQLKLKIGRASREASARPGIVKVPSSRNDG